jgi:formate-dependent nitrite reductase membrane component NrfD
VVGIGLVLPAALESMELLKFKIPYYIPPVLVIFGGIMLRFILAYAGQLSRWLY